MDGVYLQFNRGEVDDLVLARSDVRKVQNSAAQMENWLPVRLGPMKHAPGVKDVGLVGGQAILMPFVRSINERALIEMQNQKMRVWINDEVLTRSAVTTVIPAFSSWTDASGSGSSTSIIGSKLNLKSASNTEAIRRLTATTSTETGTENGIRIVIDRGPVKVEIGDTGSGSDNIFSGTLGTGVHSFSVTPSAAISITLRSDVGYTVIVGSVSVEGAGTVEIPTDVLEADLEKVRWCQSADIIYCTHTGAPFQIERRGVRSWSCVDYETTVGPFGFVNDTQITLTPSALSGDINITASANYFKSTMIGSLLRIASSSQTVEAAATTAGDATNSIRVTGVGDSRRFTLTITGSLGGGDIELQQSADNSTWATVETYSSTTSRTYDDELDNNILYYRLIAATGFSGSATLMLSYSGGSIEGIARIVSYSSSTSVGAVVLTDFGSTDASRDWYRSEWSEDQGFPSSLTIEQGRLWFAGQGQIWGSVSDVYTSFDDRDEGDSRTVKRTIGFGPIEDVHWLAATVRLVMGIASDEVSLRSSSFGELLTQTNANVKAGPMEGTANIPPVIFDNSVYYVQRSGVKLHELVYSGSNDSNASNDLNYLNQDVGQAGFRRICVSRQPETRMYCVMNDGSARIMLIDRNEEVLAWSRRSFPYNAEEVAILPADNEDEVYFILNVNGSRRLQKQAPTMSAKDYPVDMYGEGTTGLDHLNGEEVDVWADGARAQEAITVTGGTITQSGTSIITGKRIVATYKSNKLGQYTDRSVLNKRKRVTEVGMIGRDIWHGGFRFGRDGQTMQPLPELYKGAPLNLMQLVSVYDNDPVAFDGAHDVDSRIVLTADGPATIMAMMFGIDAPQDLPRQ